MIVNDVSWKHELEKLVATAKTEEEKAALKAFQKALSPYLDKPEMLRTLLGKIASSPIALDVGIVVANGEFKSLAALGDALPAGLTVVKL